MIKAFTASPKKFNTFDFDKIGEGTGVLRYALGMYLGPKETADHYQETYQDYNGADLSFTLNSAPITHDSKAYEVAEFLTDNPDKEIAKNNFSSDEYSLTAVNMLISDDNELLFEAKRGVLYEATIPHIDINDLKSWNATPDEDELNQIAGTFYQRQIVIAELDTAPLEILGIDTDHDDFESLMDNIFDMAYEEGLENEKIDYSVNEDGLRDIFWRHVRGDSYSTSLLDDEFKDGIDQKYINLVNSITGNQIDISLDMSYGDIYDNLTHALNPLHENIETNITGKKYASNFFSKELNIDGFTAPAMFGNEGAEEIILINESLASEVILSETVNTDLNQDYDELSLS